MSETKLTKPLCEILDNINSYLKKFIFMERIDRKLLCVFVAYSYIWDRFNYAVYILLHSAEKRCGKTRMQVHLSGLIRNPMKTYGGTASAYLRVVAYKKPVLLIDELDKALKNDSSADNDLLQMLNSGVEKHCSGGATTLRVPPAPIHAIRWRISCAPRLTIYWTVHCPATTLSSSGEPDKWADGSPNTLSAQALLCSHFWI